MTNFDQLSQSSSSSAYQNKNTIVIAHRGICSIFPQNTKQAIIAGIYAANLTEFDVHLTKDHQVIVFHDRYLSRLTNIKDIPAFHSRRKEETIDDYQDLKNDWWVRDFTLEELKTLRVHQPVQYRPQFESIRFQISTLEEIIEECLKITKKQIHKNLNAGLLIQIKEEIAGQLTDKDILLCSKLVKILQKYNLNTLNGCQMNNLAVVIQSFNIPLLSHLKGCENQFFQLYDKDVEITEQLMTKNRTQNVKGIGITEQNLVGKNGEPQKRVGELCAKMGYRLCYWTIRDDDIKSKPFGCQTYREVYLTLWQLGVTGLITEFPDKCKGILQIQSTTYTKGNTETEQLYQKRKLSECESACSFSQEIKQI